MLSSCHELLESTHIRIVVKPRGTIKDTTQWHPDLKDVTVAGLTEGEHINLQYLCNRLHGATLN
jgi:hypothetical protein